MNPGDIERVIITTYGYWRAEVVHSTVNATAGEIIGKGSPAIWQTLTRAGFGGFDGTVRLRIRHAENPEITSYPSAVDATAHRGQTVDEPDVIAAIMGWYVDQVLPRRTPGMTPGWTERIAKHE